MGKIIELTHDDVQNELAYALICETMESSGLNVVYGEDIVEKI